jgi:DNA-binding response OmpR family regulator
MIKTDTKSEADLTVLIVDDEIGFTDVLAKRLSKRGIITEKANSGSAAIQALRKQDFDCAILDLKMEDMNGIEVLKIFKKMVPELPVIMLTGHGCEESAKEGFALGADAYLIKPCTFEDLIAKIRQTTGGWDES